MPTYLDDQAVDLDGISLGAVLASAQERLGDRGRVVVEVRLDGQTLSGDQIEQQQETATKTAEVRLYSADPGSLALQTLEQAHGVLEDAREYQEQAAELIQEDRVSDAMERVSQAIDAWLQTQQAVLYSAMLLGIDLDEIRIQGKPVSAYTEELLQRLNTLKDLIQADDVVGLADTLAYEWPETTDHWDRLVSAVVDAVEGASGDEKNTN